jgi:hypothetical protein
MHFPLGPVAHACNLGYSEVEMGRIMVQGQLGQKVSKTFFNKQARHGCVYL